MEDWYKSAHLYLHTAWYEPFGLVFLEAMAAGIPVVSLNGKGNTDILEDGKTGFVLQAEDPEKFADTIISLILNKQTYKAVAEAGQQYSKRFDKTVKTKELIDFYQRLLQRKENQQTG